tara:strand:- start:2 stop:688 length:687 start_codon:yes stop_codon:yes gene_type:complete
MNRTPFKVFFLEGIKIIKHDWLILAPCIILTVLELSILKLNTQLNEWVFWVLELLFASLTVTLLGSYFLTGALNIKYSCKWLYSKLGPLLLNCALIYWPIIKIKDTFMDQETLQEYATKMPEKTILLIAASLPLLIINHFLPIAILLKSEKLVSILPNLLRLLWKIKGRIFYFCSWLILFMMSLFWLLIPISAVPAPLNIIIISIVLGSAKAMVSILSVLFYRKQTET